MAHMVRLLSSDEPHALITHYSVRSVSLARGVPHSRRAEDSSIVGLITQIITFNTTPRMKIIVLW